MRRISLIGRAMLATTVLALAAMPASAEARAFRLRLGVGSAAAATPVPIPARQPERVAPAGAPVTFAPVALGAAASAAPHPQRQVSQPGATTPAPVRVAGPWCPPDRIVGAGAGFCAIN